jgi:hypothetical protein
VDDKIGVLKVARVERGIIYCKIRQDEDDRRRQWCMEDAGVSLIIQVTSTVQTRMGGFENKKSLASSIDFNGTPGEADGVNMISISSCTTRASGGKSRAQWFEDVRDLTLEGSLALQKEEVG